MGYQRAVAIVPAFNEGERVAATVRALRRIEAIREVLVVDDGSSDDTAAEALRAGASCISLGRNRGKGGASNAGVATARGYVVGGAWPAPAAVLLADADLGPSAVLLSSLLAPVLSGDADLAIADLPPQPGAGGFGLVKRMARWGLRTKGAASVREPLSGQRAVAWDALGFLTPFAPGFGVEVQMTLDAVAAGLAVVEITLPLTHAVTGKGLAGSLHRGAQAVAVARAVTRSHVTFGSPADAARRWINRAARAGGWEEGREL
jgi:hypothetical protein